MLKRQSASSNRNVPICAASPGRESAPEGGTFAGPLKLQLHCATQGASIAYTFDQEENAHWLLYARPIALPEGSSTLRARAIRIGYRESEERQFAWEVTS